MTQEHPITPPPELVRQWAEQMTTPNVGSTTLNFDGLVALAARWGADQELEACCHLLRQQGFDVVDDLRATRRPKPPSLKDKLKKAIYNENLGEALRLVEQLDD